MRKKILIGVGAVVGLFIIIGIIAVATSGDEVSAPQPAASEVTASETTQPTQETETPSTHTGLTNEEAEYMDIIASQSAMLVEVFTKLGELLQDNQIGNSEWENSVAVQLTIIRMEYEAAMELQPPDSMIGIHYKYIQGMKHFYTMTELLAEGIDSLDTDLILEANDEMAQGTQYIFEATSLINDFKSSHGIE